ncbi:MAG: TRAP transporter small permease subunit [Rhodospirillaceae bacterium]|nr:TRAP transporter small permease subunit [Rhodospirillaceae bacterium]MBT3810638.1 TRAP transporter small permease subunit [Rhodospirillaceae bacterium]MBT3930270.1 TRAP transporter small permease subunit [Rhodospirillaceae bacterium]MBT4773391.1 TRAP transporter small permease subunit [Rhodospirillaceae bacterium]MBT5359775.1 TRAP transporter small permease subunit [Rhodospirillaceae bacterium]
MSSQNQKVLDWADEQLGRVAGLFAILGAVGVCLLMVNILVAVFWRYALNDPIFGIDDVSVMVLAVFAGCAVAYGARNNSHVSVDIITNFFGRSATRYTDAVMRILALGITGLAAFALWTKACGFEEACITENLSIEHTWFYYFLGVALCFYALHLLVMLLVGFANWHGEDPNEAAD